MTLDSYKITYTEFLAGQEIFAPGDWPEADRLVLCRLHTLYEMAAIHETAGDYEPMLFRLLVVATDREEPKVDILNNMRAVCND
jgi:hypothetical protein